MSGSLWITDAIAHLARSKGYRTERGGRQPCRRAVRDVDRIAGSRKFCDPSIWAHPLPPGTSAPAFALHSTPDQTVSLDEFRGRPVILAFYPADWSPVCGDQMALYNEVLPEFGKFDTALIGISVDGVWCHLAFAKDRKLRFPFWEMHEALFEHQEALGDESLTRYAEAIGLDRARFERELTSGTYATRVREDFASGVRSGVNGTATLFIDGQRYEGSWDEAPLTRALQARVASRGSSSRRQ